MASTIVQFKSFDALTLTLKLYAEGSDTLANGSGDSCTEQTNRKGTYQATVTEALDGVYDVRITDASDNTINAYKVLIHDDTSTYECVEPWVQLVDVHRIDEDEAAANSLELLVENAKGSDNKVLISTDAQDLSGNLDVNTKTISNDAITAAAAAASFGQEIAAVVETFIVNEGDATAVMQAIADKIAQDWVAGDASPLAIVAALKADAEWSNLATIASELATLKGDWDDGGRLDLLLDAVATKAKLLAYVQLLARSDSAIGTDKATELSEINANEGAGAGSYAQTSDSQQGILDRGNVAWTTGSGGGGAGSGARTVTITVDDGTDPLENVRVRMTEGANTYTADTNSSGQATFNLDDATYTVALLKAGYTYSGSTLPVSADASQTYSMTAQAGDSTVGWPG